MVRPHTQLRPLGDCEAAASDHDDDSQNEEDLECHRRVFEPRREGLERQDDGVEPDVPDVPREGLVLVVPRQVVRDRGVAVAVPAILRRVLLDGGPPGVRLLARDVPERHHAEVFVEEDVAVDREEPGEVGHQHAHLGGFHVQEDGVVPVSKLHVASVGRADVVARRVELKRVDVDMRRMLGDALHLELDDVACGGTRCGRRHHHEIRFVAKRDAAASSSVGPSLTVNCACASCGKASPLMVSLPACVSSMAGVL
mmetsp:Transcript_15046/g.60415  ORF Transcript_15046/g.60415 Transcript_15046/m.60415 type:complete len:255 (+) Transcript_15046:231-995(+)